MISSVVIPTSRMPKYFLNGSEEVFLAITKRPRFSLTSKIWPFRSPRRTRKGLGMVICPFSETVVFMQQRYECLLHLSNRPVAPNDDNSIADGAAIGIRGY